MESAEAILENENNSNVESESHIRQLSNQNANNDKGEGHGSSDSNSGPDFNERSFGAEQDSSRATLKSSFGASTDLSQESPLENDELKEKDAIDQEGMRVLDEVDKSEDLVDNTTNHDSRSSDQRSDDVMTEMVDDNVGKAVSMPSPHIAEEKNDGEEGSSENNNHCESDAKAPSERDELLITQETDSSEGLNDEKVTNDNIAEDTSVEKYSDSYECIDNDGEEPPLLTKEPETETLLHFSPLGDNDLAPESESVPKIESYKSERGKEESTFNSEEAPMDVENQLDDGMEESVTDKDEDKEVNMEGNLDEEPGTKAGMVAMSQEEENWLLDENTNKIDNSGTSEGRAGSEMEVESQDSDTSRGVNSSDLGDQQSSAENVNNSSQNEIAEPKESVSSKSDTDEAKEMELLENEFSNPPEIQFAKERVERISSKESDTAPPQLDIEMNDDDVVSVEEVSDEENGGVKEMEMEKSVENTLEKSSDEPMDNDSSDLLTTKDKSDDIPRKNDSVQVSEVENSDQVGRPVMEKGLSVVSSNEPLEKDGKQGVSDSHENESSNRTQVMSESKEDEYSNGGVTVTDIKKEVDVETYVEKPLPAASKEVKKEILNDAELGDVVIIDDKDDSPTVKKEENERKESSENGMGIQIAAVSGQIDVSNDNVNDNSSDDSGKVEKVLSNKSKTQKCIVCHKVTKCKFNIVRGGDTKQLCDDICFKKFRKSPALFLTKTPTPAASPSPAQTKHVPIQPRPSSVIKASLIGTQSSSTLSTPAGGAPKSSAALSGHYKTCSVCQVMNIYTPRTFCNWKGFDFCGEICLGKFQTSMKTTCSNCLRFVPNDIRASYCMKIGNVMHPFCKQSCVQEFMKKLKTCACCKQDLSSFTPVIARVGSDNKPKEFCSKECVKKLEDQVNDVEIIRVEPSKGSVSVCSVCNSQSNAAKHTVRFHTKTFKLCSDLCLSAFQYTNNINLNKCSSCGSVCTAIESQAHFIQFEGETKRFCSERCIGTFRTENRKLTACAWCAARKVNFDMIERQDENGKYQLFCSLNCLSLFRVNLQARSNLAVECDKCKTYIPAQYHLTMSDASVRNFCSYACVMAFQSQFNSRVTPPPSSQKADPPPSQKTVAPTTSIQQRQQPAPPPLPPHPHGTRNRGRKPVSVSKPKTPQTTAAPPIPVISSVMSLAPDDAPSDNLSGLQLQEKTIAELLRNLEKRGSLVTGDGKQRVVVESPLPKVMKNKALQCKPICQTKATACRPHSQHKDVQTDESLGKPVIIPIPVPIYIPMPTVMYRAPAPVLVPFPVPIPVPIFIPTTRKSANGIMKAIKDIQERMPADPLEAEILMMAEAVATDKKTAGDSDTDSDTDVGDNDYDAATDEADSKPATTDGGRDKGGAEDMIQMALRMAEEMSAPVEDLEASVQPVAVNSGVSGGQQRPVEQSNFNHQEDPDYAPTKSTRGRGSKRQSRGRAPASSRPKRQRTGRQYSEPEYEPPEEQPTPVITVPPPDTDYRLKFTYGVNAWKHWVVAKNAELEQVNKNSRVRPLPLDVLRCTMDELHYSLCLFIKEVRKPNGEPYSPDSIYYLCLGIQQYLYENGRIDNVFTDLYFQRFTDSLHDLLKSLQPKVNSQGQMLCRIEEEHLWESKQLGAHSPYVLLNTLIYFHTKHFILKSATDHMSLSFAQILKHWKKGVPVKGNASSSTPKNASLRFYCLANKKQDNPSMKKGKEGGVPVYEVTENFDNPLRCPVKLYEFFLSKCPESIKNRNDIFYPVPERSCVPDSPVWYSTQSIEHHTMDKMLTRILLVREIQEAHLHAQPTYLKM